LDVLRDAVVDLNFHELLPGVENHPNLIEDHEGLTDEDLMGELKLTQALVLFVFFVLP
jgi:hypothetical protein